MKKDLISMKDLSLKDIGDIFSLTDNLKKKKNFGAPLAGKTLGLIFQKPSNRTRVSFEVGMFELGGNSIYLGPDDIKLGVREATKDIAKVLSRYLSGIVARTFYHKDILELAQYATIPVINGLSDLTHPCQGLADLYTIKEKKKTFEGIKMAFVGDGNNVLHSLLYGCALVGLNLNIATPLGYEPDKKVLKEAKKIAQKTKADIYLSANPQQAVEGADIIYTDVWTSMGQEKEYNKRLKAFKNFQINLVLLKKAKEDCLIMHCLPAHRGEEITDGVIDGKQSIVYDQAENRLHVQKAILLLLLGKK
jgi:ornithine carbamoyltransferase